MILGPADLSGTSVAELQADLARAAAPGPEVEKRDTARQNVRDFQEQAAKQAEWDAQLRRR